MASASVKRLLVLDRELGKSVQDANAIDFAQLDHAISELTAILGEAVFGEVPGEWLLRRDAEDLALWARRNETLAQTIFEYLVQTGMADAGAAEVAPLPAMKPEELQGILLGGSPDAFVAQPQWDGLPRETTRSAAWQIIPLSGPWERTTATACWPGSRLASRSWQKFLGGCGRWLPLLQSKNIMRQVLPAMAARAWDLPRPHGAGYPCRGNRGWRGSALPYPGSDRWNFHPQGAAAKGLASIALAPPERREALARLFITAVDPCVGYELSFA